MSDTLVTQTPIDDSLTPLPAQVPMPGADRELTSRITEATSRITEATSRITCEGTAESTMPFFRAEDPGGEVTPHVRAVYNDRPTMGPADDLGFDRPLFGAQVGGQLATAEVEPPEYRILIDATRVLPPPIPPDADEQDVPATRQQELQEELIPTPPWPVDAQPQENLFEEEDAKRSGQTVGSISTSALLPPVYHFTRREHLQARGTAAIPGRRWRWRWWLVTGIAVMVCSATATGLLLSRGEVITLDRTTRPSTAPRRALVGDPGQVSGARARPAGDRPATTAAPAGTAPGALTALVGEAPREQGPEARARALMAEKQWARAARALRQLPYARRKYEVPLQLLHAEILHRTGKLEPARLAYAALVGRGHRIGRRSRVEALIGLSAVLLKRNYRTASRSSVRRALRSLGDDDLGGLRRQAELQLQRCEVALSR